MAVTLNTNFPIENFNALNIEKKRALYQKANEEENIELVRQLNQLGMKPEVPPFSGPNIVSNFMDVATKYDILLQLFKDLRQTNRLLTEKEFENFSDKKWRLKYSFSRMLGRDHLAKKISELHLTHIKVPTKVMVVEVAEHLQVEAWDQDTKGKLFEICPKQIKIYAEEIQSQDRELTRNEIDELIQIIASANFTDLNPGNVIVAKDGIYFIDTEFKSFEGSINWGKIGRFDIFVAEEDKFYFLGKVKEKMQGPFAPVEYTGYKSLENMLSIFDSLSDESKAKSSSVILKMKQTFSNLEYVGSKKVGAQWEYPNHFSFSMSEIL